MNSKAAADRDIRLSKKLSYLLRHGALREGIAIKPDGYTDVNGILKSHLSGYDINDIKRVVSNDGKQRFSIRDENCVCEIRANQGHSIKEINELGLRLVENPDFEIIHGTYLEHWEKIKSEGLSRVKRNHIHFSKGKNFIRGLRKNADLLIYINFKKAATGNFKFFESENGVVLCAGNERGILPTEYFEKVVTRHGHVIYP